MFSDLVVRIQFNIIGVGRLCILCNNLHKSVAGKFTCDGILQ